MMNEFTLILISNKKDNCNNTENHLNTLNELKSTLWKDYNIIYENNIELFKEEKENNFIISKNEIKVTNSYIELNEGLHKWFGDREFDFYFNTSQHFKNSNRKLAVFDMDSCLIKNECIDEMADIMGVSEKVSTITARAMAGELNFDSALKERLSLLKGMTFDQLELVWKRIELNEGSFSLISTLRKFGFKTALVSGGFTHFAYRVASRLGMDYAVSNLLELNSNEDGSNSLTGNVIGNIINGEMKRSVTKLLSTVLNLQQNQTVSMGDGSNDKLMIEYCDLGIAYHGKPILKAATPFQINFGPLSTCCFYLPNLYDTSLSPTTDIAEIITTKKYIHTSIHQLPENQNLIDQYMDFRSNVIKM